MLTFEKIPWVFSFGVAMAVSLALTALMRSLGRRFDWVAHVRADRWHRNPTALHGGVAIYFAFLAGYLVYRPHWVAGDAILVSCASAVFLLGLVDDLIHLKPHTKLIGQIIIAAALTTFKLRLEWTGNGVMDTSLTIFWLVGISNAMNLLDNMDGLAGGVTLIACVFLIAMLNQTGQTGVACLAAALCGATAGFLFFNFHPASIFMGDSGSLFLGFFLGGVTLMDKGRGTRKALGVVAIPVLLLLIPIMDTTLVAISRKLRRRPVTQGGKDHTSHRLVALGLSERKAVLTIWALAIGAGLMAMLVRELRWHIALLLLAGFSLTIVFLGVFLGRVRIYEPVKEENELEKPVDAVDERTKPASRKRTLLPTLVGLFGRGRVFEVLNDLILIPAAYFGAFLLRWEGALIQPYYDNFLKSLPGVIVVQLAAFFSVGLYRGVWRYTAVEDLFLFFKAVFAASATTFVYVLLVFRFEDFSRAVFILDAILLLFCVAGSRLSFRLIGEALRGRKTLSGHRTAIYGAGDAGEILFKELTSNEKLQLSPIIFLDDDPMKKGKALKGKPILMGLGNLHGSSNKTNDHETKTPVSYEAALRTILKNNKIQQLVVSTPHLSKEKWNQLKRTCDALDIPCRRMKLHIE